jgi:hypothetical protein
MKERPRGANMAATLEELRRNLIDTQAQLAEVTEAVAELEVQPRDGAASPARGWPASPDWADKAPLRETFAEIMRQAGIEHVQPISAEELQEQMLKRGIKPEDRLFSRGIIEMRVE